MTVRRLSSNTRNILVRNCYLHHVSVRIRTIFHTVLSISSRSFIQLHLIHRSTWQLMLFVQWFIETETETVTEREREREWEEIFRLYVQTQFSIAPNESVHRRWCVCLCMCVRSLCNLCSIVQQSVCVHRNFEEMVSIGTNWF